MAAFQYIAKDNKGNEFSGVYEDIASVALLRTELDKMGYALIKATRNRKAAFKKTKRLKQSEIVSFTYEFAGMYAAGLSIVKCLETIEKQTDNDSLRVVVVDVKSQVEAGSTLKEAFEKYSDLFSEFFVGMIEAGEAGGRLAETLKMAAEYLEQQEDVRSKIKAAFAYPVIVSVLCLVIVSALIVFVIPVFQKLYRQLNVALPGPTQALILISEAVQQYWWAIIPGIVGLIFAGRYASKQPEVKQRLDGWKLNMPVLGKVNRMIVSTKYMRTFSMMISAGVSVIDSLALAEKVVDNHEVTLMSQDIRKRVLTGSSLAEPMSEYDIFPPMIVQLADAGEESGELSSMLIGGVGFLDKKIDKAIKSLVVKIEPILSVVIGSVVGSILLAVYLPMFDYMGKVK